MHKLSVVIPVYQNEDSLITLYKDLDSLSKKNQKDIDFEFVFVDDGSVDGSFELLKGLASHDKRVKIVRLSRNFGAFVACIAGLTYCTGDCASVIAADLQDPPELILDMYKKWQEGVNVVMAARKEREESAIKVWMANLYYSLLRLVALKNMPPRGFDYFLIDRKVIDVLVTMDEKNTSLTGLILWSGFGYSAVYYTKRKRPFGKSKWTFTKKLKYFIDSFVAFSYFPIRLISLVGICVSFFGFGYMLYAVVKRIFYGVSIQGFTTLVVLILLTSGIQMIMLGVLGEYLWRNFDATRKRPMFIVQDFVGITQKA